MTTSAQAARALLTAQSGANAPGWYRCTSAGWVFVAGASVQYTTGTAFPTSPSNDDLFEFNDAATGLTGAVDYDGSTAITAAARGDVFKYDTANTQWVKQSASGTGGGATNLSIGSRGATSLDIQSDTGTDATVPSATTGLAGLQSAADKTKLDGVEASATADQTATEIKTAYESNADTNAFTDADHTKLDGIEASATADQSAAEVNTSTTNFNGTLSNTDTTVQAALDTIDNLTITGTDDQTAGEVNTDTTNFGGTLSGADTTVQAALDTIDNLTITGTDDQDASEVNTDTADFDTALSAADATVQMALDTLDEAAEATVVDVTGTGPPQASADTVNNLFVDTEIPRVWFTTSHAESDNVPTGTWAAYTNANYRGVTRSTPSNPVVGQFFYRDATSFHAWYRAEQGGSGILWRQRPAQTVLGATVTWLGDASTDADALLRIDSFDNARTYIYYNASNREVRQLDNTSYAAGTIVVAYQYGSVELRSEIAAWAEADNVDQIPRAKISLPEYLTGTAFPASPSGNDLFEFNAAATITNAVDYDGTTALTAAVRGDVFKYDSTNTQWQKQSASGTGGGGATNLAIANRDADSLEVTSDTGTDAEIPATTTALAGLQSAADKTKLDGIAVGAQPGDVTGIDAGAGITVTDGATATPEVAVTNPFTDADEAKLDGIATGAQPGDVTGIDAGTGIAVADGDTATPEVSVTNPFEAADEAKLDGIEASADVTDQSNVYSAATSILVAGTNVTLTEDDTNETVTVNATGGGGTDDQTATEVSTDTSNFNGNLSGTDTNVQAALDTIDNLNVGGSGSTDLAIANRDADSLDITSSSGTDATIESATETEAGLLSAADKQNLDGVQTFARRVPADMWDISDWARQAVYGNQRIGRHLTVAPVGEDEAVLYRSDAKLIPVYHVGQVFDSDDSRQGNMRDPSTGQTRNFPHLQGEAEQPDDFPAYMLNPGTARADWLRLRLVFTGTDVPYITGNIRFYDTDGDSRDEEFKNWEELAMYVRLQRADGMGRAFEGLFPLNADVAVGADVRGDPYSAREINFRTYLGVNTDGLGLTRPGDVNRDFQGRRNQYPGGPARTMMEAMIEWFFDEDGYDMTRLYPSSADYEGGILESGQPQPTQDQIDAFVVDAVIVFVNAVDPRFQHIEMSALHGDITAFRTDDHDKLEDLSDYGIGDDFPTNPRSDDLFEFNDDETDLSAGFSVTGTTPTVTTNGNGVDATVTSIAANANGQITAITWDEHGEHYDSGDTITISQDGHSATYTLLAADVTAAGALVDLTGKTITNIYDDNGTTILTAADHGDVFRWIATNTRWVKQTEAPAGGGGGSGTDVQTGAAFPASPSDDDLFIFNADATGLTDTVNYDGTTALTTAGRGDVFKYDGTDSEWVRQSQGLAAGTLTKEVSGDNLAMLIRGTESDSRPVLQMMTNTTGGQKAFQASRDGENFAWASFEGALGGSNLNPGFALGIGGTSGRDVELYRGGPNLLETPDAFEAGTLDVAATGLTVTQTNLGIVANAAPLASPSFTGDPTAPTPTAGDSDTSLATTSFVATSFAPLASPVFTGDPTGPTPATGDNDTSLATTAFVVGKTNTAVASVTFQPTTLALQTTNLAGGSSSQSLARLREFKGDDPSGSTTFRLGDYVRISGNFYMLNVASKTVDDPPNDIPSDTDFRRFAFTNSPALTGNPTAPTPAADDNDTSIATTAYVQTEIAGVGGGTTYQTGSAFPGSPSANDLFEFNAAATGLSDAVDYDGSTEITTAARGDVFKYDGTNWVKQSASGTGGGTDDQTASEVNTDTTNFDGNLSGTDTTVQTALETLDDLNVGGSGNTNLGLANRDGDSLDITSSSGDNVTVPAASTTEAGLMAAADKTALNGAITGLSFTAGTRNLATADVDGTISGVNLSILREFKGNDPTGQHTFGFGDYVRISGVFYMSNAQSVTVTDTSTIPSNTNFRRIIFADNPAFTGDPTGPTPAQADNDTSLATTAYVQGHVATLNALITALTARVAALEGGTPPQDHTNRAAISTDTTLTTAEYNAGTTSTTNTITIPTWMTGTRYVFIGVPQDEADITAISQGGINVFAGFQLVDENNDNTPDVIEGHHWWRTRVAQNTTGSGVVYTITQ